jgi:hypothetical protein
MKFNVIFNFRHKGNGLREFRPHSKGAKKHKLVVTIEWIADMPTAVGKKKYRAGARRFMPFNYI